MERGGPLTDEHRVGRRRSTTWDHISNVAIDLFATRGFDEVSVDDVAEAAGIARRTLFRYYPSKKNALPWGGDFDAHLAHMRDLLADSDPTCRSVMRYARHCWRSTRSTKPRPHDTAGGCGSSSRRPRSRRTR